MEEGWNETLSEKGVYLKGHRLLSRPETKTKT